MPWTMQIQKEKSRRGEIERTTKLPTFELKVWMDPYTNIQNRKTLGQYRRIRIVRTWIFFWKLLAAGCECVLYRIPGQHILLPTYYFTILFKACGNACIYLLWSPRKMFYVDMGRKVLEEFYDSPSCQREISCGDLGILEIQKKEHICQAWTLEEHGKWHWLS